MRVSSIITGAVLCVGVIGGAAILFRTRMSVSQVQGILHERISVGSSHQQVIRVLDSLGVEHSTYNPERREILALWRRSYRSLFQEGSIQARFVFGPKGDLVHYDVKELITAT